MNTKFRFKLITALVFCLYLFWDFFALDIILSIGANNIVGMGHSIERLPVHRFFIGMTFVILIFNFRSVILSINKNKVLLLLILYVLLTSIWAHNTTETIKESIFLLSVFCISIMTAIAFNNDKLRLMQLLFWLFFLLVVASIITALKFPQYGVNLHHFGRPRWIGITTHPNKLGALCLASIWISITLFYLSKHYYEKLFAIISIVFAFYALKGADSMTSIAASLVILGHTTYNYLIGTKSLFVRIAFLSLATITIMAVTTLYMSSTEIVGSTLKSSGRDTTLTGRSKIWAVGYESIEKNPLIGLGFDELEPLSRKNHIQMSHMHNGYIELIVKGGAIAGILFSIILINTLLRQVLLKRNDPQSFIFLNAGLAGILIHNIAESSILRGFNGLNILLFFIIASTNEISLKPSIPLHKTKNKKSITT